MIYYPHYLWPGARMLVRKFIYHRDRWKVNLQTEKEFAELNEWKEERAIVHQERPFDLLTYRDRVDDEHHYMVKRVELNRWVNDSLRQIVQGWERDNEKIVQEWDEIMCVAMDGDDEER